MCARSAGWGVRRLGRVMRRGVYGCTLVFLLLFVLSYPKAMQFSFANIRGTQATRFFMGVDSGRLHIFFDYNSLVGATWPKIKNPTGHVFLRATTVSDERIIYGTTILPRRKWWTTPSRFPERNVQFGSNSHIWDLPIIYIALMFAGLSMWILFVRRSIIPVGFCTHCQYSLERLESTTCPECGTTITHD